MSSPIPVAEYETTAFGALLNAMRTPSGSGGSGGSIRMILSVFDDRVECRKPGMLAHGATETVRYWQISQVIVKRGLFWSGLSVQTNGGGGFRLEGLTKADANSAKREIDSRVALALQVGAADPQTDQVARLERLVGLHTSGALSDDEFAAAKRILLDI